MADIFGANKTGHAGNEIVASTGVIVSFNGKIVLAQNANVTYQRQVTPVYELGSEDIWSVCPGANGTCEIGRAVSQEANVFKYVPKGCESNTITLGAGEGSCTAKCGNVTCTGCVVQNVGLQVQAGQGFLTETMSSFVASVEGG